MERENNKYEYELKLELVHHFVNAIDGSNRNYIC